MADLGANGYFGKGVGSLDYTPAEDLFLQGKAAMFYMGSWILGELNNPKLNQIGLQNIGVLPVPEGHRWGWACDDHPDERRPADVREPEAAQPGD